MKFLIIFIISNFILKSSTQPSPHNFNLQFIGNTRYVTAEEESKRNFCNNFWCTNDAEILFTRSSQYNLSDPCVDFRNFSIGTALDVNAVNERYVYRGFISEIEFKYWERLRRTLAGKIDQNDHRVVKIAKNIFQKCTKSRHVLRHLNGHMEVINHLKSLGSSPYLAKHTAWNPHLFDFDQTFGLLEPKNLSALDDKNLWNEENFDIEKIFEIESTDGLWLLLGYEISKCKKDKIEVLCLRYQSPSKWNEIVSKNIIKVLELMNDNFIAGKSGKIDLKLKMFEPAIENFRKFADSLKEIEGKFGNTDEKLMKIEEIEEKTGFKWLEIINDQISEKINENQKINVEKFELLDNAVKNLKKLDKRIIADYFNLSFIFLYQFIFIFHFDESFVEHSIGTKKSPQRWESCLLFTTISFLQPAMVSMYNEKYKDENLKKKTKEFIKEVVEEAKLRFIEGNNLPLDVSSEILKKIKNIKILISLENFSESNFTKYYEDLKLNETENFLETFLKIKKFNLRIRNENSWRRNVEELVQLQRITYDVGNGNILYIPSMWTLYPWYHPERPRFFNMATMFTQTLVRIHYGIKDYAVEAFNMTPNSIITGLENAVQISYNHYKNWLKSHQDLQIGANFLTNPQLFWMARAVFHFTKYHQSITAETNAIQRLQIEFMHVEFKSKIGFQEAFKCEMSDDERKIYDKYLMRYKEQLKKLK